MSGTQLHGEDPRTRNSVPGPTHIPQKKRGPDVDRFRVFKKWNKSRFRANSKNLSTYKNFPCSLFKHIKFAFDTHQIHIDVYLHALSSFVVQMGHMFISLHFHSTSKGSCEHHLMSIKTFYTTYHDNAHNEQLHCGEITSPQATQLYRKMCIHICWFPPKARCVSSHGGKLHHKFGQLRIHACGSEGEGRMRK